MPALQLTYLVHCHRWTKALLSSYASNVSSSVFLCLLALLGPCHGRRTNLKHKQIGTGKRGSLHMTYALLDRSWALGTARTHDPYQIFHPTVNPRVWENPKRTSDAPS